jgi:hypothetical protein
VIVPGRKTRDIAAVCINRQLSFVENKEWSKLVEEAAVVVPAVAAVTAASTACAEATALEAEACTIYQICSQYFDNFCTGLTSMELALTCTITKFTLALLTAALAELCRLFIAIAAAAAAFEALLITAAINIEAVVATCWMAAEEFIDAWDRACSAVALACWSERDAATVAELTAAMMLLEQSPAF